MNGICVAVCTHDRPEDLASLLRALQPQVRSLSAKLLVVDNGRQSAGDVVAAESAEITYIRLSEPGLVNARNAALRESLKTNPRLIAFIDDDEVPDPNWLQALATCIEQDNADICCGPLRPSFDVPPPSWAEQGGFFAKSGRHIGTGNMMFRASILPPAEAQWFQPAFARVGGEDEELFSRLITQGARFATAYDAWVTERVPASRLSLDYIKRTGLRDGVIAVELARSRQHSPSSVAIIGLGHAARKLGYAAAHLLQSPAGGWHLVAAQRDLCEAAGTIAALFGWRMRHYGSTA